MPPGDVVPPFVRRVFTLSFALLLLLGLVGTLPRASATASTLATASGSGGPFVRAGVGVADATWHVGSGSGQYADTRDVGGQLAGDGDFDPHMHTVKNQPSYGIESRLSARALVVEGTNGARVALVKTDNYLAQDHLQRRIAQLLDPAYGITRHNIVISATHNHSSPYDLTPSAGVWAFQDAFQLRMFEYEARQVAKAITSALTSMVPVRMGATTVTHNIFKGNIVGPGRADDGTPAGYPSKFGDLGLSVLRFDDMSEPSNPKPLATYVNYGQHPESIDGYNLISADFLASFEREVDRATGGKTVFSQGDVGSAEGPYGNRSGREQLPDGVWREWAHMGFAQMERGASYLAQDVLKAWNQIGAGDETVAVPFTSDFPVAVSDNWVPGPVSHPYPSVSNCRTERTAEGDPGLPVLGLPDCFRDVDDGIYEIHDIVREEAYNQARDGMRDEGIPAPDLPARAPALPVFDTLKGAGLPVPEHYDAPSFLSVEENARIHLQAVRLGDVLLASCSCEAQVDLILNLESRTDTATDNIWDGYPWDEFCDPAGPDAYVCMNPPTANPADRSLTVSKAAFDRMKAQIHNDAKGWDDPAYAPYANAEPADPAQIKGNFTKEELQDVCATCGGYKLSIGLGHTGDYDGYTVSYREYMSKDHYRKALTSYGSHTADYMVTRLVRMAAALQGGPDVQPEPLDTFGQADEARQEAFSTALGQASSAAWEAWMAAVPNDIGPAAVTAEPASIKRFEAATFSWVGGSNAIDNPAVVVERQQPDGSWAVFADQSGEVQTFLEMPKGVTSVADAYTGRQQWKWTANFEAFDPFPTHAARQVPDGTYRFVANGVIRQDRTDQAYSLTSQPFTVSPWDGITVNGVSNGADGRYSIDVAPVAYPRTYASTAAPRFVKDDGAADVCKTCSFRPWASKGEVESVTVAAARLTDGEITRQVTTTLDPATGQWVTDTPIYNDEALVVSRGSVRDRFGEINGSGMAGMIGTAVRPDAEPADTSLVPTNGGTDNAVNMGGRLPFKNVNAVGAGVGALLVLLLAIALLAGVESGRRVQEADRRG